MIVRFNTYESIRDLMKPKSKDDIRKDLGGLSPNQKLMRGARESILWIMKEALDEGADIHYTNNIALQLIIDESGTNMEALKYLLDKGANVHAADDYALRFATEYGQLDTIELLLKYGANPHANSDYAIQIAEEDGRKDILELFKKYGHINESVRDQLKPKSKEEVKKILDGKPPVEIFKILVQRNIDGLYSNEKLLKMFIGLPFEAKKMIMWELICKYHFTIKWKGEVLRMFRFENLDNDELVELFKKEFLSINESVRDMMKPKSEEDIKKDLVKLSPKDKLINGAKHNLLWLVKQAVEEGVDVQLNDNLAIAYASQNGFYDIVKFLLDNGVKVTKYDAYPIQLARRDKHFDIVELLKKQVLKTMMMGESVRDFLKPKPKEEIKKIIDRLPERERLAKGINMDVFTKEEINDILNGMSPREYFLNSFVIEARRKFNERPMLDKARKMMKPFKRVKIGDLLTYGAIGNSYDSIKYEFPMGTVIEKLIFKERTEFWDYVKLRQLSNKNVKVEVDSRLKDVYQSNSWMKVNCVVMEIMKPEWSNSKPILYNIIYEYGTTAGVFEYYTKKDLENSEYESI